MPSAAPSAPCDAARVMICDDSAVVRGALTRILEADPGIRVVARVGNGAAALDALRQQPMDVVVLDIEMPVMDGMAALPEMLRLDPGLRIIMASTLTTRGADIAMRALRLGAVDYLPKPGCAELMQDSRFGRELVEKILGLARLRRPPGTAQATLPALRPAPSQAPRLLAIGSSTGGPNALFTLVQSLSPSIDIPIVITQHMPANFTATLADHINQLGVLPCGEARSKAALLPGSITLAAGGRHLLVRGAAGHFTTELSDRPAENFCRPAIDPMLRSACDAAEGQMLVVILTGMGQDGLLGTRQIVQAGGAALVQDEATSVVWGMPGAVARAGLAHAVLPLERMGAKINAMLGAGVRTRP